MTSSFASGALRAMNRRVRRASARLASRRDAWLDSRESPPAGYRLLHTGGVAHFARLVDQFDAVTVAQETLTAVRAALHDAGAEHVVLPRPVDGRTVVAVDGDATDGLRRALRTLGRSREWSVSLGQGWRGWGRPLAAWVRQTRHLPPRFTVYRAMAGSRGKQLGTDAEGVTVEIWNVVHDGQTPRADGGQHEVGTRRSPGPNTSFAYLTPRTWEAATQGESPLDRPHLLDVDFPIDVVYTWVDGDDPEWRSRKDEALHAIDPTAVNETATSASRFATRDELRYSLRSLEMYAGWVRRIHLVTDGQVPAWLDVSNPRVNVVHHKEIFSDPSVLPVFNSHAIESQLHHVDGLAEHYLYLNDDVFFGRPVRPELFFEANGIAHFFLSTMLLDVDAPSARDLPVLSAAKNNRALVEREFGRTVTNKFQHTPHPQVRAVLRDMEQRHPGLFAQVAATTFRHPQDVSIAAALHHYYAFALGKAVPATVDYAYYDISTLGSVAELERIDEGGGHDVYCLNDTQLEPGPAADRARDVLGRYLARRYPVPSSFEKSEGRA